MIGFNALIPSLKLDNCCSYIIPHTPGKGYINPNILVSFYQKYILYPMKLFLWKVVSKDCSTNEYMNEFAVILKSINFKNGKLKKEILRNFKTQWLLKISHSRSNLFFQVHPRNSQKKFETEPTGWLKSKDPWKSEWIRHFN